MISNCRLLMTIVDPTAAGAPPKRRCHRRWLMTATRRPVGRLGFRARERPAQRRRHAEHVEIVGRDERAEDLLGRPPVGRTDVQADGVAGDQRLERLRAVAQVDVIGIGIAVGTASATLAADREELALPDHTWQRVPQDAVDPAEDDRGGPHAERERNRRRDRHPGPFRERTCSVPDVVEHEPSRPPRPDPSTNSGSEVGAANRLGERSRPRCKNPGLTALSANRLRLTASLALAPLYRLQPARPGTGGASARGVPSGAGSSMPPASTGRRSRNRSRLLRITTCGTTLMRGGGQVPSARN